MLPVEILWRAYGLGVWTIVLGLGRAVRMSMGVDANGLGACVGVGYGGSCWRYSFG